MQAQKRHKEVEEGERAGSTRVFEGGESGEIDVGGVTLAFGGCGESQCYIRFREGKRDEEY